MAEGQDRYTQLSNYQTIMNRNYLTQALRQIATDEGVNFHSAEESEMATQIKAYPAMWLCPPEFKQMEGRKRGKVTYSVKLHALRSGANLSAEERNGLYGELEELLVRSFMKLSKQAKVIAVESLEISCSTGRLTPHGEVAATATANVVTMF